MRLGNDARTEGNRSESDRDGKYGYIVINATESMYKLKLEDL